MGELLLELLSEEIPARMQRRALADLATRLEERLKAQRLPATKIERYVTPRRLTVIAEGIPARQPAGKEERRGPRVGAPQPAIDGFLRSAGIASLDQCEVRGGDRGEFYFAVIERPGRSAAEVLPDLIHSTLVDVAWPKTMRFPASTLRWVRPLNSVICLFDGEIVPLPLGDVPVGRVTQGHRFLSSGEISVADAADYRTQLEIAHVVLDPDRRGEIIKEGLDRLAAAAGLTVKADPGLLDEVTGLVEYPVVLMGSIDAGFVRPLPEGLPPEVLATAMRAHQKYFTCLYPDGSPAPHFLFVANNVTPDGGKTIAAGNERVLRARLSDARFFWDQDRRVPLEDRIAALKERVYHEKLGSVYDKVERMEALAEYLAGCIGSGPAPSKRAARLAKADLSTGMVGEFPELQGVMGRYYALYPADGDNAEDPAAAQAIADHYKPLGPGDTCPSEPESIAVALADKIDALAAFFSIGEMPTGSRDPFALRRAALGIIRLIIENNIRLSLGQAFSLAAVEVTRRLRDGLPEQGSVKDLLLDFIGDRLKVHLREEGVRHDLVAAVFALAEDDLVRLLARVAALRSFLDSDDGGNLLTAYRRASNIVAIEERKDKQQYEPPDNPALLCEPQEYALTHCLGEVGGLVGELVRQEKFTEAMAALATLRRPIDEFFDRVTVNIDDREVRANRLRLLSRIRAVMNRVADFSQIEG